MTGRFAPAQVQRYYGPPHGRLRGLWPGWSHRRDPPRGVGTQEPPTGSRRSAMSRTELAEHIQELAARGDRSRPLHVVDLGCGIGSSLCYLATHLPIRGTGVTLSAVQSSRGARSIREAGLANRLRCLEGDYCALPDGVDTADLAYAIESFVSCAGPAAVLRAVRAPRPTRGSSADTATTSGDRSTTGGPNR